MIWVTIWAEEHVLLTQDPVVQRMSKDLEGVEVDILVIRRNMPCTLAVISEHGQAERRRPQANPEQ